MWNNELARIAQNHAQQCIFQHNNNANSQSASFEFVGENIAAGSGPTDYINFIRLWFDEESSYSYNFNSCSGVCGHYTQVAT